MSEEQIKIAERLRELLIEGARLSVKPKDLSFDTKLFIGGLELDSVDILQFVSLIYNEYGIELTSEQKEHFETLEKLSAYILSLKSA